MANIVVRVTDAQRNGNDQTLFDISGLVFADQGSGQPVTFTAEGLDFRTNVHAVNGAIIAAAIGAIQGAESITISQSDQKTLLGGAF